jgi:hypothetical protein
MVGHGHGVHLIRVAVDMFYQPVCHEGSGEIGRDLFAAILNRQLMVSREYFNKVLSDRKNSSSRKEGRFRGPP